jgi:hypothetical protein
VPLEDKEEDPSPVEHRRAQRGQGRWCR